MSLIDAVTELDKCQREEDVTHLVAFYTQELQREADSSAIHFLSEAAARKIETLRTIADLRSRASAAQEILQACSCLHASLELPVVLDSMVQLTCELLDNLTSVQIFIGEQDKLQLEKDFRLGAQPVRGARSRPSELAYRAAQTGRMSVRHDKRSSATARAITIAVPMNLAGRSVGVIVIHRGGHPEPADATLDGLQLMANQAARAVYNARLFAKVSQQAYTDALTGLPNRRALDLRLEEETRRSSRYQHKFTLAMLDINNFKEINDIHGHPAGDLVLQNTISCLRLNLRETDFLARYGGDEFAIILPETDYPLAQSIARRLATVIMDCPVDLPGGVRQTISISIGLATYPEHAISAPALLNVADQALYKMKHHPPDSNEMRGDGEDDLQWLD
jgi:diguanylate cyclase (GGDEF)-like protein